jgi:endonuclease YncB( thermonuclease family)
MTSLKPLVAVGLGLFVVHVAFAEGSFFKDRREAAAQAKPGAVPAKAEPVQSARVQAPAPDPVPVAREVEQSDGRATTEQVPVRNELAPSPASSTAPSPASSTASSIAPSAAPSSAPPVEQRSSGSAQSAAPAPAAPANISGQVSEVPSTDTLVVGGQRVALAGVRGVSEMAPPLQRWIASTGNSVTCHPVASRYRCTTANGSDVAQVVLQNGGGTATPDAPANYRGAEMQARMGHRGIWRQR